MAPTERPSPASLEQIIADLRRPGAYGHDLDRVEVIQTHISYVLLAGVYAYKVKKPLNLGFLDYSTLDSRRRMCDEEVRLNRRLCDGVYLGVEAITRDRRGAHRFGGGGEPVEYAVRMRRVPEDQMMPQLLASGALRRDQIGILAAKIARFHRKAAHDEAIAVFGRVAAVRGNWDENFEQTARQVGRTLSESQLRGVRSYVERFLSQHGALVEERADTGCVRDCHGDLRADSVVFAPDGSVCVMDCIEFSDRLRYGDIASDVAFLAMDLEYRGHRRAADEFVSLYLESLGGDETLPAVLNFYRAYRAFVRGKVESIQADEPEVAPDQRARAADRARAYFGLAAAYAGRVYPRSITMMVGLSGTGKSFVGRAFAARAGAVLLSSDTIRRAGTAASELHPAPYGAGMYAPERREAVYHEMTERARRQVRLGRSAILDATFLTRAQRTPVRQLAADEGVPLLVLHVDAPEEVVRERLASRGTGAISDARWDTYLEQRAHFEPLDDLADARVVRLDSTRPLDELVDGALAALATLDTAR